MWSNLTVDQVLDGFNSIREAFLPVYEYEDGPTQSTGCENCSLEAKANANRNPRMIDMSVKFHGSSSTISQS